MTAFDLAEAERMAEMGGDFPGTNGALVHRMNAHGAAPDIAIGDTFARPDALGEAWEVTCIGSGLFTLERGNSVRFATAAQLLDTAHWVRARAV